MKSPKIGKKVSLSTDTKVQSPPFFPKKKGTKCPDSGHDSGTMKQKMNENFPKKEVQREKSVKVEYSQKVRNKFKEKFFNKFHFCR